jgi:hypothetical protein
MISSVATKTAVQGENYSYSVSAMLEASNDTLVIGSILFGENAPVGKTLVRFKVDMRYQPVSAAGVHLAGSFQNWNYRSLQLYSFNPLTNYMDDTKNYTSTTYERILYLDPGTYEYKFYQGNTSQSAETVPSSCASTNGNRTITVGTTPIVLDSVGFSVCGFCSSVNKNTLTTVTATPVLLNDFTYTVSNAPTGMLATGNEIDWTPSTGITTSGNVTLTVSNGLFSDTELFSIAVSEATESTELKDAIQSIYPIPSKEFVTIDFRKELNSYDVTIVNILGQAVKKYTNVNDSKLTIQRGTIASGIYYVVTSKDGVAIVRNKIIFE